MKMRNLLRSRVVLGLALAAELFLYAGSSEPWAYSAASFDAALSLQEDVTDTWLAREGVVGTAVGFDGFGHAVLKVYLASPGIVAFPQFVAGVQVVPEVTGRFMALPASAEDDSVDPTSSFPRPVPIGVSTGHGQVTAGTIGARVKSGDQTFALSNNHIFAANNDANAGDHLLQPGVVDGGRDPDDVIGTLHDYEPLRFCRALICEMNEMDAAIAAVSPDDVGFETPDGGYGSPRASSMDAALGLKVQKYGRTTGFTQGEVTGLNATIDVGYTTGTARFKGQIVITGRGFSAGGDSGSLIVSKGLLMADRRPVGLLFAGTVTTTLANPIDLVLDRFNVSIDGN
ncbi:MAG: Nal1-like putative serine protease [Longimicrobiales bacterium]